MSEKNNKLYYCTNEQLFDDLFSDPYKIFQFISDKKLDFQKNILNIHSDEQYDELNIKSHQNYVHEIDNETLV